MNNIDDIRQYIKTYALKMTETTDSGLEFYAFLHRFNYMGLSCLSEITLEKDLESAHVRVYTGGYFAKIPIEKRNELINQFNADLRFASVYYSSDALILENDILLTSDHSIPLIIDCLILLQEHTQDLIIYRELFKEDE